MDQHDRGPGALALRSSHVDGDLLAVPCCDSVEVGPGHLCGQDATARGADQRQALVCAVIEKIDGRLPIRIRRDEDARRTAAVRQVDAVDQALQSRVDLVLEFPELRIEPDRAAGIGDEVDAEHAMVAFVFDQLAVEIEAVDLDGGLARRDEGGRVQQEERGFAVVVLRDVDLPVGRQLMDVVAAGTAGVGGKAGALLPAFGGRRDQRPFALELRLGSHQPRLSVEEPSEDVLRRGRRQQGVHQPGSGIEPQGHQGLELPAMEDSLVDQDVIAAVVQSTQQGVIRRQRTRAGGLRARDVPWPLRHHELAHRAPVAVDGIQAGSVLVEGRAVFVPTPKDEALVVDPASIDDIRIVEGGHESGLLKVGGIEHRKHTPSGLVAQQDRQRVTLWRQHGLAHILNVEERFDRHVRRRRQIGCHRLRRHECRRGGKAYHLAH